VAFFDVRTGAAAHTSEHQRPVRPTSRGGGRRRLKIDQLRHAVEMRPRLRRRGRGSRSSRFGGRHRSPTPIPQPRAAIGPYLFDVLRRVSGDRADDPRRRQAPRAPVCRRRPRALVARERRVSTRFRALLDSAPRVQCPRRAESVRERRQAAGVLRRGRIHDAPPPPSSSSPSFFTRTFSGPVPDP